MHFSTAALSGLTLVALAPISLAQSPLYGQCGGLGWTGSRTCVSGSCCVPNNDWYSQCIQGNCNGDGNSVTTRPVITHTTSASAPTTTPNTPPSSGGTAGCGKAPGLTSGAKTININGQTRRYTLRLPDGYSNNKQYKVIWVYHPLGGTMGSTISAGYNGLLQLSGNANNVIFVAPDGLNNGWPNTGNGDLALTDAVNGLIDNGLCVKPSLRFATGFSYGGGMSFSIACSRAKVFRAVSVVAGAQLSGCSGGNDPIAYLGIHGVSDGTISVGTGRSLRDRFVRNNGCQNTNAPEPPRSAGSNRIKTTFQGCRAGFPVTWIAHGEGHTDQVRDTNNQLWINVETNNFFNQFS